MGGSNVSSAARGPLLRLRETPNKRNAPQRRLVEQGAGGGTSGSERATSRETLAIVDAMRAESAPSSVSGLICLALTLSCDRRARPCKLKSLQLVCWVHVGL